LAIIANGVRAIVVIYREGVEINQFLIYFNIKPFDDSLVQPLPQGSRGWGMLVHQNHAAGEENGSIMVGMFVSLCLASKKASEREFFVPARTLIGVKLLTALPP